MDTPTVNNDYLRSEFGKSMFMLHTHVCENYRISLFVLKKDWLTSNIVYRLVLNLVKVIDYY